MLAGDPPWNILSWTTQVGGDNTKHMQTCEMFGNLTSLFIALVLSNCFISFRAWRSSSFQTAGSHLWTKIPPSLNFLLQEQMTRRLALAGGSIRQPAPVCLQLPFLFWRLALNLAELTSSHYAALCILCSWSTHTDWTEQTSNVPKNK